MINKSYYFQHDYNASNDAKVLFLRQQLGMEGYGIYWFIIEQLAQSGGILPLKIIPVLAMQSQTQETKVKAVIQMYELFEVTDCEFFSVRLNHHLKVRQHLSEKGKEGALLRWGNGEANRGAISNPNAKERKKEIKEKKETKTPTLDEVKKYFDEKGYLESAGERFFEYYDSAKWHDSNGNAVRSWKQKALAVWFKEEIKKPVVKESQLSHLAPNEY